MSTTFTHNGNEIIDPMTIANKFCDFFTNVEPNLAKKLPPSNISLDHFLRNRVSQSIKKRTKLRT
mgnify:CR=1 FL=1